MTGLRAFTVLRTSPASHSSVQGVPDIVQLLHIASKAFPLGPRHFSFSVPDTASYIRGWIQMVLAPNDLFPETINPIRTLNIYTTLTHSLVSSQQCTPLTLCMLASWSRGGVVFLNFLSSSHSITSFRFPYLGSTDAPWPRLGYLGPLSPRWHPHSLGLRTLPYRDPEHLGSDRQVHLGHENGTFAGGPKVLLELWLSYIIADEKGPPCIIVLGPANMFQQGHQISNFLLQHPPAFLFPWLWPPPRPRALFSSSWPERRTSLSFSFPGTGSPGGHIWCA